MKVYFATWLFEKSHGMSLSKKGAKHHLLSFFFLNEQKITPEELTKYVRTGRFNPNKKARKS